MSDCILPSACPLPKEFAPRLHKLQQRYGVTIVNIDFEIDCCLWFLGSSEQEDNFDILFEAFDGMARQWEYMVGRMRIPNTCPSEYRPYSCEANGSGCTPTCDALEFGWAMAKKVQLYLRHRKEPLFADENWKVIYTPPFCRPGGRSTPKELYCLRDHYGVGMEDKLFEQDMEKLRSVLGRKSG